MRLRGLRVLITRPREQASELARLFEAAGAEVVSCPAIAIGPPRDPAPLSQALARLTSFDWLVFTSVNGVASVVEELRRQGRDATALAESSCAAIGPATARALEREGVRVALTPGEFRAEALAEALIARGVAGKRLLLARAREARAVLPQLLTAAGAEVVDVPAYETQAATGIAAAVAAALAAGGVDVVTFTSPSTVRSFVAETPEPLRAALLGRARVACIGPITGAAARELGLEPAVTPADYTAHGLFDAISASWPPSASR